MHHSNMVNPLVSSFTKVTSSWQRALTHFQKTLIECGSPLELEHSQRIGLLFSNKNSGKTCELMLWATLFKAEEVPAGSLFLKALVTHQQWNAALNLMNFENDKFLGDQCENMAQFLHTNKLWKISLQLVNELCKYEENGNALEPTNKGKYNSSLTTSASLDSDILATVPSYLPKEHVTMYCGLGSTICTAFPKKNQWKEATELLLQISGRVSEATRNKLRDYAAAKFVYAGDNYKSFLNENKDRYAKLSDFQTRVLLRCALKENDASTCANCAIQIMKRGYQLPDLLLTSLVVLLLQDSSQESSKVLAELARHHDQSKVFNRFEEQLKERNIITNHKHAGTLPAADVSLINDKLTISDADRVITNLLQANQWKKALLLIKNISTSQAKNEQEYIISKTVSEYMHADDWEKALLFFQ